MIKKRIYITIAIVAALLIALTVCVYVTAAFTPDNNVSQGNKFQQVVIQPWIDFFSPDSNTAKIPELLEGEVLEGGTTIMMFDQVERANISSIEVFNKNGNYKFYYDNAKADFFVEGYLNAPYSKEMIAKLIANAGYPVTMTRVTEKADDLSEYGLAESDDPAYYILTTRTGETHKVFIGNMIPSGAGFYTKYEKRDAVYVTESSISLTLLGTVENLTSPMLFMPMTQSDYFLTKDFIIAKGGEPFVQITAETEEAKDENGDKFEDFVEYRMVYPSNYTVSTNYDVLLQGFMEPYGNAVLELAEDGKVFSDEILEKYNLKKPAYELLFTHNGIKNSLLISPKTEDGVYYIYSLLFNIICDVPADALSFLEWELLEFVEKPLLMENINDVESIKVKAKDFEETFTLFTSEGETTTNPVTGATTTATNLDVKMESTGQYVKDSQNFRQFYMVLLTTNLISYADVEDETGLEHLATITVKLKNGKTQEFSFYPYTTRRCFYTLNGKGEFYVLRDTVDKLVSDAKKLVSGETVDHLARD